MCKTDDELAALYARNNPGDQPGHVAGLRRVVEHAEATIEVARSYFQMTDWSDDAMRASAMRDVLDMYCDKEPGHA